MRKISMFAAALILIAVGAWAITTTPRVVASTPVGIDPFQMMPTHETCQPRTTSTTVC